MFPATSFLLNKKNQKVFLALWSFSSAMFRSRQISKLFILSQCYFWLSSLLQKGKPIQYMERYVLFCYCVLLADHFCDDQRTTSTYVTVTSKHILFHPLVIKLYKALKFCSGIISCFRCFIFLHQALLDEQLQQCQIPTGPTSHTYAPDDFQTFY